MNISTDQKIHKVKNGLSRDWKLVGGLHPGPGQLVVSYEMIDGDHN